MKRLMLLILTALMFVLLFGCNAEKTAPVEEDMKVTDEKTVDVENEEEKNTTDEEAVQLESEEDKNITEHEPMNVDNEEKAYTTNEAKDEYMTKEQIMEYYGFSEEELDGIDVDAVLEYDTFTKDDIIDFSKEEYLHYMKRTDKRIKTDIGYLFKGEQPDGKISFSQIKTIAFLEGENAENDYWHIRVQDKKAYYCLGYNDHLDLEENYIYSGTLTNEYISELQSCLEKANLHKWKAEYEGNSENADGSWGWLLGIELIDGTVYSWRGWGLYGDNQPKEYQSVKEVFEDFYDKCPIKINENNEYAIKFYG